jgi:hypothetical protein
MARPSLEPDIDHLYQVPLGEFIAERNALAKRAGGDAADVRNLQKPTSPAWAVNQLYWKKRPVYDELLESAADLRATHQAALRGRAGDLRGASQAHEEAVDRALKATLALLADRGAPVTDATRQAIATTLRSLPSEEAPGRLSRQLQPRGFEVLEQAASQGRVRAAPPAQKPAKKETTTGREPDRNAARVAAAREAATAAARASREAEQIARREEFEVARATRDAEKAERRLAEAEQAVEQAQAELDEARRAAAGATKTRETARTRATKAAAQLAEAREREHTARKQLDALV